MLLNFHRLSDRRRRTIRSASRLAAVFAGLLVIVPAGFSASATAPDNDRSPAPLTIDDGFTRESLMEFDAPEPALLPPAPTASVETSAGPARSNVTARRHRRLTHHRQTAQPPPPVVVVRTPPRRNPAESFVYWWNGWVIRTFHTKLGTVLLDSIGAKT